jgi:hypothetical protein
MRIGGPGAGASVNKLVPVGTGRTEQARREQVEPVDSGSNARAGFAAAFATTRHPYVRVETAVHVHDGQPVATVEAPLAPSPPQGPFLAQYIAQERLGRGLTLSQSEDGASAYRRAERPLVAIRSGATVDTAA